MKRYELSMKLASHGFFRYEKSRTF